ncbi:MAG: universal stress protein [Rubrivivax sp.]|nr:MAG: universal stress protein [Rubrivivax sp.]
MYEHLLVPVDDSELSDKAMETSVGLAKLLGASITGFTVEPALPPMVMEQVAVAYTVSTIQDHHASCEAHARKVLKRFADRAVAAGVPFDGQFMVTDGIQQAIVDMAERQKCDLIVMATHGRHGFDALIHGSLTKSVLSHSKLPLLIIH